MVFTGSFLGGAAMPSEENKKYGFVKKFRSILKSKFWEETSPEQYRIAEFILYSARFKREEIELRNGEKIIIEPGQLLTTISYIQNGVDKKGKWATEKTVKYALDKLQKLGFLSKKNIKSVPKFWYEYDIKGAPVSQKRGSSSNKLGLQLVKKGASHCTLVTVENWAFYQGEFENGAPVSQSKGSSITKEGLQLEQKGAITKECIYKNDIYNMSDSQGEFENGAPVSQSKGSSITKEGLQLEQKGAITKECIYKNDIYNMSDSKESDHSPGAFKSDNNNSNKTTKSSKTKRATKVFEENSIEYQLSKKLYQYVLEEKPKTRKPDLQKWSKDFDLILRRDERSLEDLENVIDWIFNGNSNNSNFWKKNISSPGALRGTTKNGADKFAEIYSQMENDTNYYRPLQKELDSNFWKKNISSPGALRGTTKNGADKFAEIYSQMENDTNYYRPLQKELEKELPPISDEEIFNI